MLGYMLRHAGWLSRSFFLVCLAFVASSILRPSEIWPNLATGTLVLSAICLRRDAFRKYREQKHPVMRMALFTRYNQAYRYLIFCENLPATIKKNAPLLKNLLQLLEQRQRVRQSSAITRNPTVTVFTAVVVIVTSGLVSRLASTSITLALTLLFVVFMLLLASMQIGFFWRTREYKDEEMAEFVLWLEAEASDVNQTDKGG